MNMPEKPFEEPRVALNRIYTRTGDAGETALASGERVPKDAPRIECYGTVDELNSFVGLARQSCEALARGARGLAPQSCESQTVGAPGLAGQSSEASTASAGGLDELSEILLRIQHELFNLGSVLATSPEKLMPRQPRITEAEIAQLEREIDRGAAFVPPLRSFVLPGGSRLNAELHVCRTVCRRAERLAVALVRDGSVDALSVRYLNRLSDALFVFSRWANVLLDVPDTLWQPNRSASGQ
jgi:cob(I)alamin adenosyltransferase